MDNETQDQTGNAQGVSGNSAGALVPSNVGMGPPRNELTDFFGNGARAVHNFDGDAKSVWRLTAKATGAGVLSIDEFPKDGAGIEYYYCHIVPIEQQESGEIIDQIRTVLFCDNGELYGCVSSGIANDVSRIAQVFAKGKFTPPLKVRVDKIKTRNKFTMLTLTPLD